MSDPRLSPDTPIPIDSVEKPPVHSAGTVMVRTDATATPLPATPLPPTALPATALPATALPATAGTLQHWVFLLLATGVVVASVLLHVRGEQEVVVPWINLPLPGTCTFLRVTGMPCPGCGLTRSFISIAHGRPRDAWHFNPAGILFFAVVAFQIPYRAWQIVRIRQGRDEFRFTSFDQWTLVGLIALLLVQWLVTVLTQLW